MPSSLRAIALACTLAAVVPAARAAPEVVATIPPLHSLAAQVMAGIGTPALLLPGGSSPHTASLKPSQAQMLNSADLVAWVGPELETFLVEPLETLSGDALLVRASTTPGVELLDRRLDGVWAAHDHGEAHAEEHHADAAHGEAEHAEHHGPTVDGHLWLAPANAAALVDAIAAALAELDPANAAAYRENAATARTALEDLDTSLKADLAPVARRPFVVFHDAYQYFEDAYGLTSVGSVVLEPDLPSSAGHVRALRDEIRERGAVCVFHEPQFEPRLVATVIEGTPAEAGVLDPLGTGLTAGPALYGELLRGLADGLVACLTERH
jgi:zinc transport system substrate-binding protein